MEFVDGEDAGDLLFSATLLSCRSEKCQTGDGTFSRSCFTSSTSTPLGRLSSKMFPDERTAMVSK